MYIAIGPCISKKNYEVKKDFLNKFLKKDQKNKKFFKFLKTKIYFDLTNYICKEFKKKGIKNLEKINKDTFNKKNNFFSSRRAKNENKNDYGRNISIIMIK
ncbi:laccase domain-containing protein, partial [Candidatus Pelagibacter sp.]|nr:laccase domain-containing protein [Candidatus Pelagibacter sp.]